MAVGHLPFAGVYAHGQEVFFTSAVLKELDQLSETVYFTARYRPELRSEPTITIPQLLKVRTLQKLLLSKVCGNVGKTPLGCQGVKEIAKG